jgi:hypothetical protein
VRLMIQHETGLHCGPTLSTCRFAVFHGVTSDEDPKLVRGLTSELDANPFRQAKRNTLSIFSRLVFGLGVNVLWSLRLHQGSGRNLEIERPPAVLPILPPQRPVVGRVAPGSCTPRPSQNRA